MNYAVLIWMGLATIGLGLMAWFDVAVKWMLVAAFPVSTLLICSIVLEVARRLDIGCSFHEQCVIDIEQRQLRS